MSVLKEHVSILLDSRKRQRGSIEEPIFSLTHQITFSQKISKSYHMRLENTLLPKSFYSVDANFNVFRIAEQGGGTIVVTIDVGSYTILELLTELENELDTNTTNSNNYVLTYDDITNKVAFQFTGTSTNATIQTIASGSTINQIIGVGKEDTDFITGNDNTFVITAGQTAAQGELPNCVDLDTKSYIVVKTDISSNNYYDNNQKQNVAVRVPINVDRNIKQHFSNDGGHKTLLNSKAPLSSISFSLEDEYGNVIDLCGIDWSTELIIYELTEISKQGTNHPNLPKLPNSFTASRLFGSSHR